MACFKCVALAVGLLLAAVAARASGQHAPDQWLESAFRTTSADTVYDASSLGGVQHFSLPVAQGTCGHSATYGFAKCLLLPSGTQAWRFIVSWARVTPTRLANVAEDLSAFGPYQCEPPVFYLESVAGGSVPLTVHERGGLAFMPVALKAFVPAARAAPSYALRIEGSDYLAVLDAEGGCATPADLLSVEDGGGGGGGGSSGSGGSSSSSSGGDATAATLIAAAASETGSSGAAGSALGDAAAGGGAGGGSSASGCQGSNGGDRCAAAAPPCAQPGRLPATSWVLLSVPPPWNDDLTTHVLRLREHLEWHRRVGFTGHILYYDPAQATRLARDPAFMQLLGSYRVAVVRWAQFPKVAWLPWDAQGLRLSHAYLALWGWDAGLLPIDVDEFLLLEDSTQHPAAAMPPGSALRALVQHCGGGADGVTFERFAVYCSSGSACPGGDEAGVWRAGEPPAALAGANASDGGWSWADGDRSGLGPSRLAAYRAVEAVPHVGSKAWSTSACTFPASVHEHRLSGLRGCAHVQARPSCGRLLHAINSFHFRDNWLAPGRAVAPFRHPWWPAVLVAGPEAAVGVAAGEPEGVAGPAGVGLDALGAAAQVGAGGAAGAAVAQQ